MTPQGEDYGHGNKFLLGRTFDKTPYGLGQSTVMVNPITTMASQSMVMGWWRLLSSSGSGLDLTGAFTPVRAQWS
jgi:hypothetical protein